MKCFLDTLIFLLLANTSFAVGVASLPDAAFPDTEVSTNFTIAVGAVANRKLVFALELQASPSNLATRRMNSAVFDMPI